MLFWFSFKKCLLKVGKQLTTFPNMVSGKGRSPFQGRQSWGLRGRDPLPDIGQGWWRGGRGLWGHGRVVKYYILSCTGGMFESGNC